MTLGRNFFIIYISLHQPVSLSKLDVGQENDKREDQENQKNGGVRSDSHVVGRNNATSNSLLNRGLSGSFFLHINLDYHFFTEIV